MPTTHSDRELFKVRRPQPTLPLWFFVFGLRIAFDCPLPPRCMGFWFSGRRGPWVRLISFLFSSSSVRGRCLIGRTELRTFEYSARLLRPKREREISLIFGPADGESEGEEGRRDKTLQLQGVSSGRGGDPLGWVGSLGWEGGREMMDRTFLRLFS